MPVNTRSDWAMQLMSVGHHQFIITIRPVGNFFQDQSMPLIDLGRFNGMEYGQLFQTA